MKPLILSLLSLLVTGIGQAQELNYLQQVDTFKTLFNKGDAQSIFDMMNSNVQEQLGYTTVEGIVRDYREAFGDIQSAEFLEKGNQSEVYMLNFVRGKQKMALSLDDQDKLKGLRFMPVSEDVTPKIERNLTRLSMPFSSVKYA